MILEILIVKRQHFLFFYWSKIGWGKSDEDRTCFDSQNLIINKLRANRQQNVRNLPVALNTKKLQTSILHQTVVLLKQNSVHFVMKVSQFQHSKSNITSFRIEAQSSLSIIVCDYVCREDSVQVLLFQ